MKLTEESQDDTGPVQPHSSRVQTESNVVIIVRIHSCRMISSLPSCKATPPVEKVNVNLTGHFHCCCVAFLLPPDYTSPPRLFTVLSFSCKNYNVLFNCYLSKLHGLHCGNKKKSYTIAEHNRKLLHTCGSFGSEQRRRFKQPGYGGKMFVDR